MYITVQEYRDSLARRRNHRNYLMQHSGLPGPRPNIELARAFAETAGRRLIFDYASIPPEQAPDDSPKEFLAFCGVLGLGRLAVEGKKNSIPQLRNSASDQRSRIRKAVSLALQIIGMYDMSQLTEIANDWAEGNNHEQQAAVSSICEPKLLVDTRHSQPVLQVLDKVTETIESKKDRSSEAYKELRKSLSYCWGTVVEAYPREGKPLLKKWKSSTDDVDVMWIMRKNQRLHSTLHIAS